MILRGEHTGLAGAPVAYQACDEYPVLVQDPAGQHPAFRTKAEAVVIGRNVAAGQVWGLVVRVAATRTFTVAPTWVTDQPERTATLIPFPIRGRFAQVRP